MVQNGGNGFIGCDSLAKIIVRRFWKVESLYIECNCKNILFAWTERERAREGSGTT